MVKLAKQKKSWIMGGMCHPSENEDMAYNTAVTFNPNGERIDAHEYISRRLRSPSHKVFGSAGSEIWYSKPRSIEEIDLDSIWDDISGRIEELNRGFGLK